MKYQLSLLPRFLYYRRELLSYKVTPPIELSHEIEASLQTQSQSISNLIQLWMKCLKVIQWYLIRSCCVSMLTAVCATSAAVVAMRLLMPGQAIQTLLNLAFAYFVASSLGQIGVFYNNKQRIGANHTIQAYLGNLISRKLNQISSRAAARHSSGNLKILMTSDVQYCAEFLDNVIRNLIPAVMGLIIVFPCLIFLTGKAGLVGILIMLAFLPIAFGLNYVSTFFQKKGQNALDFLASLLGEWVKNIRLIRYLSWDEIFQKEVSERLKSYMKHSTAQHFMACLIFGLSVSWWMFAILGILFFAQISNYSIDLVGFFGSLWLVTFLAGYFIHLPNTIRLYALASPSLLRIYHLLKEEEQDELFDKDSALSISIDSIPKRIIFDQVSFSYDGNRNIIQNLSVTLDLNQKIAIIGEVGCGKSTFLKLLCGEIPPSKGNILIEYENGIVCNLWVRSCYEAYRKNLVWVPQESFVSCNPISENIALHSSIDENFLLEAIYWAELEADINLLPHGMNEEIGEGGVNLSGGQKQRINLARAYYFAQYFNRNTMILDDALSAVDPHTGASLMRRFLSTEGKGFLWVTHRISEMKEAHDVLVMKDGKFIERGSPQLLSKDPFSVFSQVLKAYENTAIQNEIGKNLT